MDWKPNNVTREAIGEFLENMVSVLPGVMGIDEVIAGCKVISLDPYGVGVGTYPRYIQVALRDRYYQDIMYRGGLSGLAVGDYVTVVHMRDGNRYELLTAGGSTGVVVNPAPAEAHYVTTQADATLTNEHVAQAGQWTAIIAAAGTFQTDFHPDNPVVVTAAGVVTEYATIQDAIDAAASCDTVLVPPGTYGEAITLGYGVAVKGFGHRAKIIISSATDTVTTAQYGWLENVTIVANNPNAGAFAGVKVSHNGPCWLRDVTIEVDQGGANVARGIGTLGTNSGTLTADRIDISVVSSAAGAGAAYGVDFTLGSYELELKNFKVAVAHTGAAGGDDAYGIVQAGSTTVKATEGWLGVTATGAGVAADMFGTITYSEIVSTANHTLFGQFVGIGKTLVPGYELDIVDAADNTIQAIRTYSDTDAHAPALFFMKSHHDTAGTLAATTDGDYLGNIRFYGVDTGLGWALGAWMYAIQRGAAGADYVETDLILETWSATAVNASQLFLDGGTGFVGIGTPTPGNLLHVYSATTAAIEIEGVADNAFLYLNSATDGGAAEESGIFFQHNNAGRFELFSAGVAAAANLYIYDFARAGIVFSIVGNGDMTLMGAGGNVGIGAAPGARLDVDGGASDDPLVILDALDDADSAFIDFKGGAGASCVASVSTLAAFAFTTSDHIKIKVNGAIRYIRTYTCDPG